jgi:hypothetical protein
MEKANRKYLKTVLRYLKDTNKYHSYILKHSKDIDETNYNNLKEALDKDIEFVKKLKLKIKNNDVKSSKYYPNGLSNFGREYKNNLAVMGWSWNEPGCNMWWGSLICDI